jgi:hypothetical protein
MCIILSIFHFMNLPYYLPLCFQTRFWLLCLCKSMLNNDRKSLVKWLFNIYVGPIHTGSNFSFGEAVNAWRIFVEKPLGNRQLGMSTIWEEGCCKNGKWIGSVWRRSLCKQCCIYGVYQRIVNLTSGKNLWRLLSIRCSSPYGRASKNY